MGCVDVYDVDSGDVDIHRMQIQRYRQYRHRRLRRMDGIVDGREETIRTHGNMCGVDVRDGVGSGGGESTKFTRVVYRTYTVRQKHRRENPRRQRVRSSITARIQGRRRGSMMGISGVVKW